MAVVVGVLLFGILKGILLADSGVALNLAEMHGTVRDMVKADGLLERLDGSGRRIGIAEILDG